MHHMHAAFTTTATSGAGRLTTRLNNIADKVVGFFRVGHAKDMPVVAKSPVLQPEHNDEDEAMATIPKVWVAHTPVRMRARAVNRMPEQNDEDEAMATIPKIWLARTPVRKSARAVNRMLEYNDEDEAMATVPRIRLAHAPVRMRVGTVSAHTAEETFVFICRTPVKLTQLTGPPPLKRKGIVQEEEDASEEMNEAIAMWMSQRMKSATKEVRY